MPAEKRYFLHFAFDGTQYCGWQRQPNGITVQETLENQLGILLKHRVMLTGCGRTDTGVHATDFYAHFDTPELPLNRRIELCEALNHTLPSDIVIYDILPVREEAHARYSALWRTYRYYVSTHKDPFHTSYRWFRFHLPDIEKMNQAAALLLKTDDFTSFAKLHSNNTNNLSKVTEARWEKHGHELIFTITANRFLRNMVRAIVGTLWDVGRGRFTVEEFQRLIENKNRSQAGASVPASGLFLEKVEYPAEIFLAKD
ncbi:MAG: tRNA pseudouridine(38-40) synthase TruA [Bacteroidales bacterium]|nr:tRNA pseudouridine(38-40) synthase TruA [Bacteroidales bacterium]